MIELEAFVACSVLRNGLLIGQRLNLAQTILVCQKDVKVIAIIGLVGGTVLCVSRSSLCYTPLALVLMDGEGLDCPFITFKERTKVIRTTNHEHRKTSNDAYDGWADEHNPKGRRGRELYHFAHRDVPLLIQDDFSFPHHPSHTIQLSNLR
jgi:hypothetical protein